MVAIVERPTQNDEGRLRYGIVADESFKMYETTPGRFGKKPSYQMAGVADRSGKLTRKPLRTGAFKLDLGKHPSDTFAFRPDDVVSRTFYADGRHVTWQVEFLFREDPRAICLEDGRIYVRENLIRSSEYLKTLGALARAYADVLKGETQIPGVNCPEVPRDNGHGVIRLEPPI